MKGYTSPDVAKLLGLTVAQVRGFARDGFLTPGRGRRGELLFSFQDLVILRTAKGLVAARIPTRRIRGALRRLRAQLPRGRSLAELRIAAEDWYELGLELEVAEPTEARDAYRRALELDAHHADARVNLGRLLHEQGLVEEAERHYRLALRENPEHATAAYNLGIALEDLGRAADAIEAYRAALAADPRLADAHYNVARLYEKAGKKAAALRHLSSYKRLTAEP